MQKVNPKIIIAVGIVILIVVLVVIFIVQGILKGTGKTGEKNNGGNTVVPTGVAANKSVEKADPKAVPSIYQQSAEYLEAQKNMDLTIAPENEKSKKAGMLLEKVPYEGKYFTFDYSTKDLAFKVIFNKDRALEGNDEFNLFLKNNGIDDKSWLRDLKVEYK